MTIIQFITELIKILSEFQSDWKQVKAGLNLSDKTTFADWLSIFTAYAIKSNDDVPFWTSKDEMPF